MARARRGGFALGRLVAHRLHRGEGREQDAEEIARMRAPRRDRGRSAPSAVGRAALPGLVQPREPARGLGALGRREVTRPQHVGQIGGRVGARPAESTHREESRGARRVRARRARTPGGAAPAPRPPRHLGAPEGVEAPHRAAACAASHRAERRWSRWAASRVSTRRPRSRTTRPPGSRPPRRHAGSTRAASARRRRRRSVRAHAASRCARPRALARGARRIERREPRGESADTCASSLPRQDSPSPYAAQEITSARRRPRARRSSGASSESRMRA